MVIDLNGRTALVTGSSRGLGAFIAESLAQSGADTIINGRDMGSLHETALRIGLKTSKNIYKCCLDTTKPEEIIEFFQRSSWLQKLDILVNNVGNVETFGSFEDLAEEDWQRSFDLSLMSAVRFIKAALPLLRKSDQARIINIASLAAHQPGYFNPHYSLSKAALLNLSKYLANYLGKDRILVNVICPSTLTGDSWNRNVKDRAIRAGMKQEQAEEIMTQEENKKSPLSKMGEFDDVTSLVVFLSSPHAKFLTGHCYNVDGGITRSAI